MDRTKVYIGKEAVEQFLISLNSFFQDDATGNSYGVRRNRDTTLDMMPFTGCGIEDVALDVQKDVSRLAGYEMIVIDSGNSHGDAWKAVFYPRQQVLSVVREDIY